MLQKMQLIISQLQEKQSPEEISLFFENLYANAKEDMNGIFKFPEEFLADIEMKAMKYYTDNFFEEALPLLQFLSFIKPNFKTHWLSLGKTHLQLLSYENALKSFGMACLLDEEDPVPYFFTGYCYYKLKNVLDFKLSLQHVLKLTQDKPIYCALRANTYDFLMIKGCDL
jgi:tetratricopeptide (TPR) repeat protein